MIDAGVGDELVSRGYLDVITGFEPTVVHGVLFHARKRGVGGGFRIRVMPPLSPAAPCICPFLGWSRSLTCLITFLSSLPRLTASTFSFMRSTLWETSYAVRSGNRRFLSLRWHASALSGRATPLFWPLASHHVSPQSPTIQTCTC